MPRPTGVLVAWLTQWWTVLATLIVVFVPGLIVVWSIGLRRLAAAALAPVASVALISLVATLFGLAHIPWTLLSAALGVLFIAVILVAARFALRLPVLPSGASGSRWPVVAALIGASVLIGMRFVLYIGDPSHISQSNDAPFHLGAVRAIIEHANASSFGLAGLLDPEATGAFYPGAWHGTASLIVLLSGSGIPEATNALSIVVGAVMWPLGIAWLTQVATRRRLAAAAAAALSPALLAFPLLLIQYGILYSYLIGVALLPAAIAAVVLLARRPAGETRHIAFLFALIVGVACAVGALGTSQPSTLLPWALAVWVCGAGGAALRRRRDVTAPRTRWLTAAAVAAGAVLVVLMWGTMSRLVTADYWGPVQSLPGAAMDVLSSGYAGTQTAWAVSLLVVAGIVAVVRRPGARWVAITWVGFVGLYIVAATVHAHWLRLPLVGPWYSDTYRLAALLPVMTIPLAAIGVTAVVDAIGRIVRRRGHEVDVRRDSWLTVLVLLLVGAIVFAVHPIVQRYHVANGVTEDRSRFVIADDTWLSLDERTLLERLPATVPEGAVVLGNPGTGAAFGYALSGVDVFPAKWQIPRSPAYALLSTRLPDASTDPEVCAAVRQLGAGYVLDFGPGDGGTGREKLPGFTGFSSADGFELIDRQGDASLWRITACP